MAPLALAVDQNELVLSKIRSTVGAAGYRVSPHTRFETARQDLRAHAPHLLITAVRLQAYNGIHLAHLARITRPEAVVIVYDNQPDVLLAREAQRSGAFYEAQANLLYAVTAYLTASLPDRDRRDPTAHDRRAIFRGGRRTTDLAQLHLPSPRAPFSELR